MKMSLNYKKIRIIEVRISESLLYVSIIASMSYVKAGNGRCKPDMTISVAAKQFPQAVQWLVELNL